MSAKEKNLSLRLHIEGIRRHIIMWMKEKAGARSEELSRKISNGLKEIQYYYDQMEGTG